MRFDNMQPNVWHDPEFSKWRAWYSAFTSCSKPKSEVPFCDNAPQQCGSLTATEKNSASRGTGFLYAESEDGISWTKPNLGMTEWKGSKANNLIELDGMTTGIYLDPDAGASERYKIAKTKDLQEETHGRWDTPKNVVWDP